MTSLLLSLITGRDWLGIVPTVLLALGVVVAIVLFERKRAVQIDRDLKPERARHRR